MLDNIKQIIYNSTNKINNSPVLYLLTSVIELFIIFYVIYKWNPFDIKNKYPVFTQLFIIFVVFVQILNFMFIKEKVVLNSSGASINTSVFEFTLKILITLLSICCSVVIFYLVIYVLTRVDAAQNIFIWSVNIFIVLCIVSIIYLIARTVLNKKNSSGNVSGILLYLPSIFVNFIEKIKNEFKITTKTTWIILILLVILVGIKFMLPIIANKVITSNGLTLLSKPVFLNSKNFIGSFDTLYGNNHKKNYEYSLSFWYWIDSLPPNTKKSYTKYTNILEFGKKPSIQYNALENTLRILCEINEDKTVTLYETTDVPLQRWNNIVINYDKGTMDVFMNGVLVSSKPNIVPYLTNEIITVGEDRGIEGRVSNIVYQREILSSQKIKLSYNALKHLNNPII